MGGESRFMWQSELQSLVICRRYAAREFGRALFRVYVGERKGVGIRSKLELKNFIFYPI